MWRWSWVGCSAPPTHPGRCCGIWFVKDGADSEGELSSRLEIEQRNADRPPLAENALVVAGEGRPWPFGNIAKKWPLRSPSGLDKLVRAVWYRSTDSD